MLGLGLAALLRAMRGSACAAIEARFIEASRTIISSFTSSGKCDAFAVAAAKFKLRCVRTVGLRAADALLATSLIGIDMMKGAIVLRQSNCRSRYVAGSEVLRGNQSRIGDNCESMTAYGGRRRMRVVDDGSQRAPKYLSDHLIYVGRHLVPFKLPPWQGVLSSQRCWSATPQTQLKAHFSVSYAASRRSAVRLIESWLVSNPPKVKTYSPRLVADEASKWLEHLTSVLPRSGKSK